LKIISKKENANLISEMFLTKKLKEITTATFLNTFVNVMNENIKFKIFKVSKPKQHVGNVFNKKLY